ncbi:MAG: hypothetical protein HFJ41_05800 [Clostridia bacterium]|nr:hypothetical protein [Clostridia bacterium]
MYIYVKELSNDNELKFQKNIPKFIKYIIIKLIKIFNIIVIQTIKEDEYLYIIPRISNLRKLKKVLNKNKANKIILSKKLKTYSKQLGIQIQNRISKYFIYNILKYIQNITNTKIELQSIYFLTNVYNTENIQTIAVLAENIKSVNVITNKIKEYSKLEKSLYDSGNLIAITNNKRKSLRKANFIINLDLNNEEINSYNINRNSIIINCANEKISKLSCFDGIIINNIEIKNEENELSDDFDYIDILVNHVIKGKTYYESMNIVKNIEIVNLIGSNGIINKKEILNIKKNLTNT